MAQPPVPALDFGKMMTESFLPAREAARDALIAPIVASVSDALTLTGMGLLVLVAFALAAVGIASRDFVKAVLGVLAAGCLLILATAWWGHTTATPTSAGLGALLLLAAVLKGWRGAFRLLRFLN